MNIECKLETRTSKEGNPYKVVIIKLAPNYEKFVFLDKAELALLEQHEEEKYNF